MKTWQILAYSAALAALGVWLLRTSPSNEVGTSVAKALASRAVGTGSVIPKASAPLDEQAPSAAAAASPSSSPAPLSQNALAPDDGPGGDPLVQALLEAHTRHKLLAALQDRLNQLGRAVWIADLSGEGRNQWPSYFTSTGTSGYTHVRVQAAVARGIGAGHAEVTLIWAGTTPAGDPEVGLPATVLLAQQADGTWEPVR